MDDESQVPCKEDAGLFRKYCRESASQLLRHYYDRFNGSMWPKDVIYHENMQRNGQFLDKY